MKIQKFLYKKSSKNCQLKNFIYQSLNLFLSLSGFKGLFQGLSKITVILEH